MARTMREFRTLAFLLAIIVNIFLIGQSYGVTPPANVEASSEDPLSNSTLSDDNAYDDESESPPPPEQDADTDLAEKFNKLSPRTSDCDPDATTASITFINQKNNPKYKNLWEARTDFNRLRKFLSLKGFLHLPGSIMFLNAQDKTMHLRCSPDNNMMVRWRSQGRKNDKQFNEAGRTHNKLADEAPSSYLYFRRIFCSKIGGGRNGCQHYFYIITRPYPRIDKPQSCREGEKLSVECKINPCLYDNTKSDSCPIPYEGKPRFIPPFTMGWIKETVPYDILTEKQNDMPGVKIIQENHNITTMKTGHDVQGVLVSVTMKIEEADTKHSGLYECVIVDENGVPSTPSEERDITFEGRVRVHVRAKFWIFVPVAILAVLIITMIILSFCCPHSMEHDDGTKYTKEEMESDDKRAKTSISEPEKQDQGEVVNIDPVKSLEESTATLRNNKKSTQPPPK